MGRVCLDSFLACPSRLQLEPLYGFWESKSQKSEEDENKFDIFVVNLNMVKNILE